MATVENRIVEMRFDNAEFERRVSDTMKTLAGLDKAIAGVGKESGIPDLAKQVSGFSTGTMVDALGNVSTKFLEIGKHASDFSTANMTSAIEGVSAKFIAMSAIAITALQNITNRVIDTGIQIAKSLSLDQVTGGFDEYELKLGSIQTIMAGSGESLDVVNKKLQELNAYSDKTIYSFKDMTSNIGKFTNAGVDLDTAVASIQGIANVAAISGANAEEASRAMYNFAQALSKGSVGLVDWKSIELANMATKEFKQQLIDSAVAVGTLTMEGGEYFTSTGRAISATVDFNDSLTDAWLTTDVLTGTLADYSDATTDIGARATAAASDVKTFSQLMDTTKESIGSGWATTFELLLGNFDEAKWLFSGINDALSGFIGKQADQRNQLLEGWRALGGWGTLIEGVYLTVKNVGLILKPIMNAFRDIFPPMTAERLFEITEKFRDFAAALEPSGRTMVNIGHIFRGLFNVLDIGWEILKIGIGVVVDFVKELTGLGGGGALQFFADIGKALEKLTVESVVQAFKDGFEKIQDFIRSPIPVLKELWTKITEFFAGFSFPDSIPLSFDNLTERFGLLGTAFDKAKDLWKPISEAFGKIKGIFDDVKEAISGFFDDFESDVKTAAENKDYSGVADAISIGLLGGILAGIVKLFKNGINIDFTGGLLGGLKDSLEELTGVLDGMQKKLKAEALKDIAIALAILAGAILALSLVDAEDLAKAMTAMAVGFGQLIGVFEVIQKLGFTPSDTAKFIALSVAFAALGVGSLVLAGAAKVMSTLDWEEIAKGLVGITGLLTALVATTKVLKGEDLAQIGGQMIIVGGGLLIMGLAMKLFATMDWEEIGKGFAGVATGLGSLAVAMKLMPNDLEKRAVKIMEIAASMVILAFAMKQMAELSWTDMAKGLIGVGGGLAAIGIGLKQMPKNMAVTGFSILIVSAAMILLATALEKFSEMSWGDIMKGVIAIVATLLVLSVAMKALEGSLAGSVGLFLLTKSLGALSGVLVTFANIGFTTILSGLLGLGLTIGTLALAAYALEPVLPAMIGLGIALFAIGIGIAGIGFGAKMLAEAFVTLGNAGKESRDGMIYLLEAIAAAIPALMAGVARGLVEMGKVFLENIPFFVDIIGTLIVKILEKLTELIPVLVDFIIVLVQALVDTLVELYPIIIQAGYDLLLGFLGGIRDNIGELVTVVTEIIQNFLNALTDELPDTITSVVNFFIALFEGVAEGAGKVAGSLMFGVGIAFLKGFIDGMVDTAKKVWEWISGFVTGALDLVKSLFGIKSPSTEMKDIGINVITGLLDGLVDAAVAVWDWFANLASTVIGYFSDAVTWLFDSGKNILTGLWNGAKEVLKTLLLWVYGIEIMVKDQLVGALTWLVGIGKDVLQGLWDGAKFVFDLLKLWFVTMPLTIMGWFGDVGEWLLGIGKAIINGLWKGMKAAWEDVKGWVTGLGGWVVDHKGPPSKDKVLLYENGRLIFEGLHNGMKDEWKMIEQWLGSVDPADAMDKGIASNMAKALVGVFDSIEDMTDMQPVITPVIDLSYIRAGANEMNGLLGSSNYATAAMIAGTPRTSTDTETVGVGAGIQFTQINNSPEALSTADIYRNTRNQITLAKEELSIP